MTVGSGSIGVYLDVFSVVSLVLNVLLDLVVCIDRIKHILGFRGKLN